MMGAQLNWCVKYVKRILAQPIFLQKQEYEDLSHVTVRRNNRAGRPH